ncbi:MAG TPA: 3-hydroxyacyl-ACP dehydratase FabZ [Ferrovibrio sp.]|jgi:3-hydroxyacyl-[acyl-carrier-protein] dehydratase|uniref:3-hydroxyacyl-ACP dehydratase FabZ n=1 Tax=Ferrovibrio sp. TaxID=1917215 RepID=UPI002B4ABC88|nr:3-hydroxyacyl-ACP dehydratase FabZ [Ferrovibrio sp.]HLT79305.1 3-hydroxyacyl-ACP dehydratase FabZ [Ferrovibrio sp.]
MNDTQAGVNVESIDILRIMEMIPHRYPMLLIDRVTNLQAGKSAVGIKNVTINEPQFTGHFPSQPVMPGVMIVESMAQTAAVVVVYTLGKESEGKLVYFMTIDEARFRKPVVPGDQMHIHVSAIKQRGPVWKFEGKAMVDGKLAAEAIFSAMILDKK